MELDSEDEFVEKKKPKKKELPKGQKRLTFASQGEWYLQTCTKNDIVLIPDKKIEPVSSKKASGTAIDPSNFFGGPARSTVEKPKEKEKVREEKNVLSLKNQVCSYPLKFYFRYTECCIIEGGITEEVKDENSREEEEGVLTQSMQMINFRKCVCIQIERDEFSEDSFDDSPKKKSPVKKQTKKVCASVQICQSLHISNLSKTT